jgi:hypothetical protein
MKVLTDEEHEKNCFQFKPIPFTARDRILQPTGPSRSPLTNTRSTFVPISAPASVIDLALSQEQIMGSSRKAYMTGYRSAIEAIPKKQFEAFEEEQVEEQADIPETRAERVRRKMQERLRMTPAENLELARMRMEDMIQKGETDPRVRESLDILKSEGK